MKLIAKKRNLLAGNVNSFKSSIQLIPTERNFFREIAPKKNNLLAGYSNS